MACKCQNCGEQYKVDLIIPDKLWNKIKPENKPEDAGLLCGSCIMKRIEKTSDHDCWLLTKESIMDFNEYQEKTGFTDIGKYAQNHMDPPWLYYVLGIGGETGELLEKVKKLFRDYKGEVTQERIEEIKKEMGDCLWYHARLAEWLGFTLNDVAEENITKLLDRKERNKIHGDGDER